MTRGELLDWLGIEGEQLDGLLSRGLPTQPGGQYSPTDVAAWLEQHGLAETQPAPSLPAHHVRTKRELAKAMGRTRPTIDDWLDQGCPGDQGGYYDVQKVREWRNQRDRELRRPQSYRGASTVSDADLHELRDIVKREIDHESGTHYHAVCDALVAVLKLGHSLPKDVDERRKLLIEAICPPFKPWITSEADMPAKVEERMAEVLECLPQ